MQGTPLKAFTGLVALILAAATPGLAQDTLTMPGQGGGADTAGFSAMERNDPTGARDQGVETGEAPPTAAPPPQAAEAAPANTGAAGGSPDPNGFRWTEPSDFAKAGQTPPVGATDAVQEKRQESEASDSTKNE